MSIAYMFSILIVCISHLNIAFSLVVVLMLAMEVEDRNISSHHMKDKFQRKSVTRN